MNNRTETWKQASEVFASISELSPKEALAKIHSIKNITSDVRKAVITLINAGSQATQFFSNEISDNYNFGINNNQNFQEGQLLNEYELLEEIGHGGMSQVFKAKRINTDQQTLVAIKVFAPRESSSELLNHFINEQKILSELSHPHIIKMLHGGMTDDKTAYLVMDLIEEAQPLDQYCKNNKFTNSEKMKLIAQCADALAYTHANLIIHRDLKPENILINKNKELKIVDFGIAKLINNDISGNKTTIMALTPSYAAPEQINSKAISVKTDIFSLAVVALELISRHRPLPKDRLIKSCTTDEQHLDAIIKKSSCKKDLKNILRKALEQEPNKRYSSMQSFADDLNNYLLNKPVNATSQSLVYRIQKFANRRVALFATLMSFLVFMIIGSILGYQQYQQIKIEAEKANQVKKFMLDAFEVTDPDNNQGVKISANDLLKIASDKLQSNQEIDKEIKFDLIQTLGLAYGKLGSYEKSIDLLRQSLLIKPSNSKSKSFLVEYLFNSQRLKELDKLIKTININNINTYKDKARILRVKINQLLNHSEFLTAHQLIKTLINQNQNPIDLNDKVKSQRLLAKLFYYESKPQESIKLLKALLENDKLSIKNTVKMGIRSDLAGMYNEVGDFELSITQWLEIIQEQRNILGNNHPELVASLVGLSTAYMYKGELVKANNLVDEAHTISERLFGPNNLITANALNTKSILLKTEGKIKPAIDIMYQVVEIYEHQQSINYQDTNIIKVNLAQLLNAEGQNNEAFELVKNVFEYQNESLGQTHPDTLFSQQVMVRILIDLGETKQAVIHAKQTVENAQEAIENGNNSSDIVGSYYTLALAYQADKKYPQAIDNYLYLTKNDLLDPSGLNYAILVLSMAKLYDEIGDFINAKKHYTDTIQNYTKIFSHNHIKTLRVQLRYANLLKNHNQKEEWKIIVSHIQKVTDENNIEDEKLLDGLRNF